MGVIFTGMGQLVRELRQQNPQDHSQREGQFQRFAGQYMQDIHLDQWIDSQGGTVSEGGGEGEREGGRKCHTHIHVGNLSVGTKLIGGERVFHATNKIHACLEYYMCVCPSDLL